MPSRGQSADRTLLRAVLLGAGAIGGYLLLSLFAGPASADEGPLGGAIDQVTDAGSDLSGLLEEDLPLPDPGSGEPVEPSEPTEAAVSEPAEEPAPAPPPAPEADPEPVGAVVESVTPVTDRLVDTVTDTVAGTEPSSPPPAVDPQLPVVAPVVDDATDAITPGPLIGSFTESTGPTAPTVLIGPVPASRPAPADGSPDARDDPAQPGDPPVPPEPTSRPPPAAIVAGGQPHPVPGGPPDPAPSTHQVTGKSFDPGHPSPMPGPSTVGIEPDLGLLRSHENVAFIGLVMPVSAPPG
jgi:hypothetical protein